MVGTHPPMMCDLSALRGIYLFLLVVGSNHQDAMIVTQEILYVLRKENITQLLTIIENLFVFLFLGIENLYFSQT